MKDKTDHKGVESHFTKYTSTIICIWDLGNGAKLRARKELSVQQQTLDEPKLSLVR